MKHIGIVGSRNRNSFEDFDLVVDALESIYDSGDIMVSGGCKQGADSFAKEININTNNAVRLVEFLPDLKKKDILVTEKKLSQKAAYASVCYERNTLIANKSDVLIACISPDRKGGTEDTIKKFLKRIRLTEDEAIILGKLILV